MVDGFNLKCKILGHKIRKVSLPYLVRTDDRVTDHKGDKHQVLAAKCCRCGELFPYAKMIDYFSPSEIKALVEMRRNNKLFRHK